MVRKHTYKTTDVERVDVSRLLPLLGAVCVLAIDVAKTSFVAGMATAQGVVQQVLRFAHPKQTLVFLKLIEQLQRAEVRVQVIMEPTGIYGDVVRYQCHKIGCEVFMVRPKFTHDMSEVLDGVPSMHDGKAVHVLAQLHALGRSTRWVPDSEQDRILRALIDQRRFLWTMQRPAFGYLEALLSKWWPGLDELVDVYTRKSVRELLKKFAGPTAVAARESEARQLMRQASCGQLREDKIEAVVASAKSTLAQPPTEKEQELLKRVVEQVDEFRDRIRAIDKQLEPLVKANEMMNRLASMVGVGTAATLVALVGNPLEFESAKAYEKAFGLNLKVRSSGKRTGQLAITKRGSSDARQLMYMAALRHIRTCAITRAWYVRRDCYKGRRRKQAVVAVMRKLVKAMWHVARGATFDATKLFDTRRLDIDAAASTIKASREAA